MTEYQKLLFLTYFKDSKAVNFDELLFLMGLNSNGLDSLIREMLDAKYIEYINYKLQITDSGVRYLIANNQINSNLEADDYILRNITPDNVLPLDEPFAPKNFLSKL